MRRATEFVTRSTIIALALVALGWTLGLLIPAGEVTTESTGMGGTFVLPFVTAFLLAAALAYPISRSRLSGKSLFSVVFLAVFGLMTVLTLVEAALFLTMGVGELAKEFVRTTLTSVVLAWLAGTLYPKTESCPQSADRGPNPPSTGSWIRRWIGVSLVYVVLYITAGVLILPLIRTWYEAQGSLEPDLTFLFPFQVARGALFVACVLPLLRSMRVTRWQASLAMAVMIPLLHGVAGLIPPSPYMPGYVRHAHMLEIGWSNFVLGLLIGFLFWNPLAASERVEKGAGPSPT